MLFTNIVHCDVTISILYNNIFVSLFKIKGVNLTNTIYSNDTKNEYDITVTDTKHEYDITVTDDLFEKKSY